MKKLTAEGYCGKQHTLDELEACADCSAIYKTQSSVGIRDISSECITDYEISIWNAAIEAAALVIPKYEDDKMSDIVEAIRKLKK